MAANSSSEVRHWHREKGVGEAGVEGRRGGERGGGKNTGKSGTEVGKAVGWKGKNRKDRRSVVKGK